MPRKIQSKLRPTPPPRTRKPIPPPRTQRAKPVPPPRPLRVKLSPQETTCDHETLEEIDSVIFCIHCGLETDHQPYWEDPRDKEVRGLTFRKASARELLLPLGRKLPENTNMVSKYEKARVIGVRARQIANLDDRRRV